MQMSMGSNLQMFRAVASRWATEFWGCVGHDQAGEQIAARLRWDGSAYLHVCVFDWAVHNASSMLIKFSQATPGTSARVQYIFSHNK